MSLQRLAYRGRQFWLALRARPAAQDLEQARLILRRDLFALFTTMQPGEQVHSLHVLRQLLSQGEEHPDLLVAALLHDVGKGSCASGNEPGLFSPVHFWGPRCINGGA
jgi:hypothetical protein